MLPSHFGDVDVLVGSEIYNYVSDLGHCPPKQAMLPPRKKKEISGQNNFN